MLGFSLHLDPMVGCPDLKSEDPMLGSSDLKSDVQMVVPDQNSEQS